MRSSAAPVMPFSAAACSNFALVGSMSAAVPVTCTFSNSPNSYEGSKTARHTLRFSLSVRNLRPPSEKIQNWPACHVYSSGVQRTRSLDATAMAQTWCLPRNASMAWRSSCSGMRDAPASLLIQYCAGSSNSSGAMVSPLLCCRHHCRWGGASRGAPPVGLRCVSLPWFPIDEKRGNHGRREQRPSGESERLPALSDCPMRRFLVQEAPIVLGKRADHREHDEVNNGNYQQKRCVSIAC